jgi:hypothetical protein
MPTSPHDLIVDWLKERGFRYRRETDHHKLYRKGNKTVSVRDSQKLSESEAISIATQSGEPAAEVRKFSERLRGKV